MNNSCLQLLRSKVSEVRGQERFSSLENAQALARDVHVLASFEYELVVEDPTILTSYLPMDGGAEQCRPMSRAHDSYSFDDIAGTWLYQAQRQLSCELAPFPFRTH
jgi:hypothetical protein